MKLGIAVVYLFGEQNEKLLDLHLAMIEKHTQVPYTICLFFHRDFYLQHQPRLRPSLGERASPQYKQYIQEWDPLEHSGVGYGFRAYSEGLSWHYLKLSGRLDETNVHGLIHGDLVFHLGGATVLGESPPPVLGLMNGRRYSAFLDRALQMMESVIPVRGRRFLGSHFSAPMEHLVERPQAGARRPQLDKARQQLLEEVELNGRNVKT